MTPYLYYMPPYFYHMTPFSWQVAEEETAAKQLSQRGGGGGGHFAQVRGPDGAVSYQLVPSPTHTHTRRAATHSNTLQQSTGHCNTLQQTVSHVAPSPTRTHTTSSSPPAQTPTPSSSREEGNGAMVEGGKGRVGGGEGSRVMKTPHLLGKMEKKGNETRGFVLQKAKKTKILEEAVRGLVFMQNVYKEALMAVEPQGSQDVAQAHVCSVLQCVAVRCSALQFVVL